MVVDPLRAFWQRRGRHGCIPLTVEEKPNLSWTPFHRIDVKFCKQRLAIWQRIPRADPALSRVTGPMNRSMHNAGLLADVFHRIDLSALLPTHRADILSQHPERGPEPSP